MLAPVVAESHSKHTVGHNIKLAKMTTTKSRWRPVMEWKKHHLLILTFLAILGLALIPGGLVGAQDTKGSSFSSSFSSTKGGVSAGSAFRQSIQSVRQRQQQQQQQQIVQVPQQQVVTSSVSRVSSSSVQQTVPKVQSFVNQISSSSIEESSQEGQSSADAEPAIYGSVSGQPGIDFPAYARIPQTSFTCQGKPFETGMYADEATGCQVYHLCYQGRRESFLCGLGTIFNQAILNCDFWHSVDCSRSSEYYHLNADFGRGAPEPGNLVGGQSSWSVEQREQQLQLLAQRPAAPATKSSSVEEFSVQKIQTAVRPAQLSRFHSSVSKTSSSGKTSLPNQLSGASILSPGRRLQVASGFGSSSAQDSDEFGLALQSVSRGSKVKASSKLSTASSTQLRNNTKTLDARPAASKLPTTIGGPGKSAWLGSSGKVAPGRESNNELDSSAIWRPYFKSKANRTTTPTITTTAAAASRPPPPPTTLEPPATVARPDKEPDFSVVTSGRPGAAGDDSSLSSEQPKVPEMGGLAGSTARPEESQPETSGEPDVSVALDASATPTPPFGTPTTSQEPSSSGAGSGGTTGATIVAAGTTGASETPPATGSGESGPTTVVASSAAPEATRATSATAAAESTSRAAVTEAARESSVAYESETTSP